MEYALEKAIDFRKKLFNFVKEKETKKEFIKELEKYNLLESNSRFEEWFIFEKSFSRRNQKLFLSPLSLVQRTFHSRSCELHSDSQS